MRKVWVGVPCIFGMLVIILDSKTALVGASEGIELCLRSVIPSLFPLIVLSILLNGLLNGTGIPLLRPLGQLCGIPKGAENLLISGFLGGYPVGAQSVAQMYEECGLPIKSAKRLLGFCSNAGPAFVFGIVASKFSAPWMTWALWGIHIISALLTGVFLPEKTTEVLRQGIRSPSTLTAALNRGVHVTATVCGWVIIFRVLLTYLHKWFFFLLTEDIVVILSGILELTNGCCELERITDEGLRFIIASGLLSFGGICVVMQTKAVTKCLGIDIYLKGKLLQCIISICLACMIWNGYITPTIILVLIALLCRETKKSVAIRQQMVYNRRRLQK